MSRKTLNRRRYALKLKNPAVKSEKKSSSLKKLRRKDNLQLFTLTWPGLILMFLFKYLPMYGLVLAFKKFRAADGIWGSKWVGFKNFEFFFKSGKLWELLTNTVGMNLLFLIVNTLVTILLALLLFELRNRMAIRVYQTVIFLPFIISWVVASYAVYANLSDGFGIINGILKFFGKEPVSWYKTAEYWPYILLICYLWKQIGYGMIIYYGNLMSADTACYEAAILDGANRVQRAWYISWPVIRPTVIMFFILTLGSVFSADFGLFYYLPKNMSQLYSTTDVIDTYVFRALTGSASNVGMSTAIGLLQSVTGFIVLILSNAAAKKVDEGGAVF